jgi:ubiquinone/menaquinone biosynthesis C-methylase UbiE
MSRLMVYRETMLNFGYDYTKVRVLQTAFELDIFERLREQAKSTRTLAEELNANSDSLQLFLNALVSLGLLDADGGGFKNTKFGAEIFLKGKPLYIGDYVELQRRGVEDWLQLRDSVLSGKQLKQPDFFKVGDEGVTTGFALAMHNTALGHAEVLAKKLKLESAKTLLDLGGGPGTFTAYFLKANPELRATIFDLPATLKTTRKRMEEEKLTDRVSYQEGDFGVDAIGGSFDVCFLSHIIHGQGIEKNQELFRNIFHCVKPGGRFIVQDFFLNSDRKSPQFAALFALHMLIHTDGGRTYTFDEVSEWMRAAGFSDPYRTTFRLPRSIGLLIAERR